MPYYYSVLTDKVSRTKTSSMRKYPKSYQEVQFSELSRANFKQRESYADEYMHEVCYQQIKAALNKKRNVYSLYFSNHMCGEDYLNAFSISDERGRDFRKGDKFLGDVIPVPRLSKDTEGISMFQELAAMDKDNLVAKCSTYIDDRFCGTCDVAIKASAIDRSDIHYNFGPLFTITSYMGTRRFQSEYTDEEFYKNILSDKETLGKYKFDPGAVAKLVKLDLSYAQEAVDTNLELYNSSLKRFNEIKGYYESLGPEEMLIAEVSD